MGIGEILVGINLKMFGAASMIADLNAIDIATRRNAISMRLLKDETFSAAAAQEQRLGLAMESTTARAMKMRAAFTGLFALGGAAVIASAVSSAAHFQLAMTAAGISSAANPTQLQQMSALAMHMSGQTAQTAATMAQEMAVASQTGLGVLGPAKLMQLYPLLAKFADVQQYMAKGRNQSFDPVDAIGYGVQFAHMLGAYTPDKMSGMLEDMNKFLTVQSEPPMRALRQAKYFVPLGHALGMSDDQLFQVLAIMGQTSFLQGRGGSGMGRVLMGAINSATMTGHLQKAQGKALQDLGIIDSSGRNLVEKLDTDKTSRSFGKMILDWTKFQNVMASDQARMGPIPYSQDVKAAFGLIAGQWMNVLEMPEVREQLKRIEKMWNIAPSIDQAFEKIMGNFLPQWTRFITNIVNLGIDVMLPALPMLTQFFKGLADGIGWLGDAILRHPNLGLSIAIAAMGAVALAAMETAGTLLALRGSILAVGTAGAVATGEGAAGGVAGGFLKNSGVAVLIRSLIPIVIPMILTSAVAALFYGFILQGQNEHNSRVNRARDAWSQHGANSGITPPYTRRPDANYGSTHGMKNQPWHWPWADPKTWEVPYAPQPRQGNFKPVFKPVTDALIGSGGTNLADTIKTSSKTDSGSVVDAVNKMENSIVSALAGLGLNITIPGPDGKAQTIHRLLHGGGPLTGGKRNGNSPRVPATPHGGSGSWQ